MALAPKSKSPQQRKILVIGADPGSRETLLEPLRWELYDVRGVASWDEALQLVESWVPVVILIDSLPDTNGRQILQKVRAHLPHSSCVYISEDSQTESIIAGLDQGADDYIVKPFVPLELLARVRTHLRLRDLHEQLVFANEMLKELVDTDDLTGLYNMRSLYQRLSFELERARRFNRDVCVVMLDMDHFKMVNDGHDHLFGSYVISEIGKVIKANTRNIDIPARYGGDEFLVVLSEVSDDGAVLFCERLRKSVEQTLFKNGDDSIKLTVSIGYAITRPGEVITARELVRQADHALYEAKRTGRNRVCAYRSEETRPPKAAPKPAANVRPLADLKKTSKSSEGRRKKAVGD